MGFGDVYQYTLVSHYFDLMVQNYKWLPNWATILYVL